MALRSILRVIRTRAAGNKYWLAIKYTLEVASETMPVLASRAGRR
jgi:hypothetical protein